MKTAKKEKITKEFVRVFVYGTLKKSVVPNSMPAWGAEFVGTATIKDATVFVGRELIPFIKDAPGKVVNGEVWNLPVESEARLDHYERAYTPRIVETTDGVEVKVYFAPEGKYPYSTPAEAQEIGSDYSLETIWKKPTPVNA